MKLITFKITEEEEIRLEQGMEKSGMNRSDYIRACINANPIQVIGKSKEFYQSLHKILSAVDKAEEELPTASRNKVLFDSIREEVFNACQLLNL